MEFKNFIVVYENERRMYNLYKIEAINEAYAREVFEIVSDGKAKVITVYEED